MREGIQDPVPKWALTRSKVHMEASPALWDTLVVEEKGACLQIPSNCAFCRRMSKSLLDPNKGLIT